MVEHMSARVGIQVRGDNPPLALEFGPRGEVLYLRISDRSVARTAELKDEVLVDYDAEDHLVGIEILGLDDPGVVHVLARLKRRFANEAPQLRSVEAVSR